MALRFACLHVDGIVFHKNCLLDHCRGVKYCRYIGNTSYRKPVFSTQTVCSCYGILSKLPFVSSVKSSVLFEVQWNAVRCKSKWKKLHNDEEESDEEILDDDDFDAPAEYKTLNVFLSSLRMDNVVGAGLGVARNRISEEFYKSGIRLNGEKLLKKSVKLDERDYVDIVTDRLPDTGQMMVKRVKVIKVSSERTLKDKVPVTLRVWRRSFPVEDTAKHFWE